VTPVLPSEVGAHDGLAYSLWLPEGGGAPRGGVVVLHGAGSCKENHHDFARAALGAGLAAIVFDQRGHGASEGAMDGRVIEDIASVATILRARLGSRSAPVALRGSSMGGYLAILAAPAVQARAVVAICPASAEALRRGLADGAFEFGVDTDALDSFLSSHDLHAAVADLDVPLLLLHAEGDERVPVEHSRELAERMRDPRSRLITVPGGHHRSIQHDPELVATALRWLVRVLEPDD
jgi:alpha-beta hydrolase superfamily lysophospholipase